MVSDQAPQQIYPPDAAEAFNKANAAFKVGDFEVALAHADIALKSMPDMVIALLVRARCLRSLAKPQEALVAYQKALSLDPANFNAHLEAGNIYRQFGDFDAAVKSYSRASESRPSDHRGALAAAKLFAANRETDAQDREAAFYHRALVVAGPRHLISRKIHEDMGDARLMSGRAGPALEAFRQAWLMRQLGRPDGTVTDEDAALLINMARCYLRLGLEQDARIALERAARVESAEALRDVATLCYEANFWEDGIAVLRRGAQLHPQNVDAHLALSDMLSRCWQLEDARAALEEAHRLTPIADATRHQLLAKIANSAGDTDAALFHQQGLIDAGVPHASSGLAMTLLYSAKHTSEEIAARHRALFAPLGEGARPRESFPNSRDAHRPLRIGMVTSDLHRQHPVNLFMQPVFKHWPEEEMPLTIYFTGKSYDAQTRLARARVGRWREITHEALAQQVASDGIDILIDLAGHTSFQSMRCFAQRLAPVQVTYLGYPGSTGVPCIDWILADAEVAPKEHSGQFSERIKHLPNAVFCYAPETHYEVPAFPDTLCDRPLTFGSFNNVPKLTPETIGLWAQVLQAVPGSRLILKAPSFQDKSVVARYQQLFGGNGIAADRLNFRGPVALDLMMQEYADVDIGLDPLHYNGGTTTLQAMWMGVPVLTMTGDKFASRMGTSFMKAADLDQFVARDEADFIAKARAAAEDRAALWNLKRGLRQHLQNLPGWNVDVFTTNFEKALREIWIDTCCAGG
ncbi:MAG: tetratricopeptide repeat protein [Pseudomonadota bacterium]